MAEEVKPSAAAVELAKEIIKQHFPYEFLCMDNEISEISKLIDQHTADLRAQLANCKTALETTVDDLELAEEAHRVAIKERDELRAHAKAMREALDRFVPTDRSFDTGATTICRQAKKAFDDYMRGK